jgi:hypothetical protein
MAHEHDHHSGARTSLTRTAGALRSGIIVTAACLLAAGCGNNSPKQTTAAPTVAAQAMAFSRCMRKHGVANFPDPSADGQVKLASSSGINFSSPAFNAAQSACQTPTGGGSSTSGAFSAKVLTQFLAFATCMRGHGVTDFPDPTTSPPPAAPGHTVSNDGVYLFIPITIDVNSPTYAKASAACRPYTS